MKKIILPTILALSVCQHVYANNFSAQINSERPNVLFILAEDMNPRLGVYGDPVARTPNLDALAKESVMFTNAFTMAGVSAPSRTGLITGVHPHAMGLQHMRTSTYSTQYMGVPPSYVKAYPELLRRNGYYTYVDVKTDYQFTSGPSAVGPFTIWDNHGSYSNIEDLRVPAAWRQQNLQGKPFFINLNPQITHESGMFTDKNVDQRFKMFPKLWGEVKSAYQLQRVDPDDIKIAPYWKDTPEVRAELALFYENINVMDQQVGNVIKKLKEDNLWDNTIVIFSADNGDGLPRHKREGYDSGTHVPLIVHVPEKYQPKGWKKNGSVDDRLVSFEDLAPTVLGFTQTEIPFYMKGFDYSQENAKERDFIYSVRGRMDEQYIRSYYLRDRHYQYVQNIDLTPNGASVVFRDALATTKVLNRAHTEGQLSPQQEQWYEKKKVEELYNLDKDPFQINNVSGDKSQQKTLNYYREKMEAWRNQNNDMGIVSEAQMVQDLLNDQGKPYVTLPPVAEVDNVSGKIYIANRTTDASIGYSMDGNVWQIYTQAFLVPKGVKEIKIKAVRYGWEESDVVTLKL